MAQPDEEGAVAEQDDEENEMPTMQKIAILMVCLLMKCFINWEKTDGIKTKSWQKI